MGCHDLLMLLNLSPLGQNGCYFTDDIFKCIFTNENFCNSRISLKLVPKCQIDNKSALVQAMANKRQPITWPNAYLVGWHIYATLGGDELTFYSKTFLFSTSYKTCLHLLCHTMDMLWEKFQWILPLCMKPISFQSKAAVVCSVTAAVFIDFSLKKLNVFS